MSTRRDFLKTIGGCAGLAAASTLYPGLVFAKARTDKRLVVVILRGGMDGMAALAPYGDKEYQNLRGELAIDSNSLLRIDPFFGLHPSLDAFAQMYKDGDMIAVPATASPYRERSHFDAQNVLELGSTSPYGLESGWLNRLVGAIDERDENLGLALGQTLPQVIRGQYSVSSWAPSNLKGSDDDYMSLVAKIYASDPVFSSNLDKALDLQMKSMDVLDENMAQATRQSRSAQGFVTLSKLAGEWLSEHDGPRIATLELGGWDTHIQQGTEGGQMANNLGVFGRGLKTLKEELGEQWSKTVVIAMTEFGRTARPNGNRGTDHGTAGTAFLFGGALRGGRILHDWPGLSEENLYQGRDLRPTIDIRSVVKSVLSEHFDIPMSTLDRNIYPGSGGLPVFKRLVK